MSPLLDLELGTYTLTSIILNHSRITMATFSGNPQATIICCYSPTNADSENSNKRSMTPWQLSQGMFQPIMSHLQLEI